MPELRIEFDPCNPAQFYACCGLIELFDLIGANTLSRFQVDWHRPRKATFVLVSAASLELGAMATALRTASYRTLRRTTKRENAPVAPDKDPIAPVFVKILGKRFVLDWWLDEFHEKAGSLKCWAGKVTTKGLFTELPKLLAADHPFFDQSAFTTTRFGIDPRSAWVALNLGYSPNEQGQPARTYPLVEMLAIFGLQGFRPGGSRSDGFTYHLWCSPLFRAVARSACVKPWDGLAFATYRFALSERGSYKYFGFAEPVTFS
jgi:CRISPR-associated protein Csx14